MEVVVFMGLPGSGKSSFYRERLAGTHVHLSKDLMPNARNREERLLRQLDEALAAGKDVAVDNTHVSRRSRAGVLARARAHGAHVTGLFFRSRLRECLERNATRTGRARVPDKAVCILAAQLQPPRFAEGFDTLLDATLTPSGFHVRPWRDQGTAALQPAEPHHAKPRPVEPDLVEPDLVEPDLVEPEHVEPEHVEPEHVEQGAGRAAPDWRSRQPAREMTPSRTSQ